MFADEWRDDEAKRAKERHEKLAGRPKENGGNVTTVSDTGKTRDKIGEKVGVSGILPSCVARRIPACIGLLRVVALLSPQAIRLWPVGSLVVHARKALEPFQFRDALLVQREPRSDRIHFDFYTFRFSPIETCQGRED